MLNLINKFFAKNALTKPSARSIMMQQYQAHNLTVDSLHGILRKAESGDVSDLFALYRDVLLGHAHIQAEYNKRKVAVLRDPVRVSPKDNKNADDIRAAELVQSEVIAAPGFLGMCNHLLNASLYPVSLAEITYDKVSRSDGSYGYKVANYSAVPYHVLDYRDGNLKIMYDDINGEQPWGPRYIIHRGHLLTHIPDNWGGPFRAVLFWWFFSAMSRDMWINFLDKYGTPFVVAKHEDGNDGERRAIYRALSAQVKKVGIVLSKESEIELHNVAASSSGDAFQNFKEFANREISKLILGQTTSSEAQATGLGSGVAMSHADVRADLRQLDITLLLSTLKEQLIYPYLAINNIKGEIIVSIGGEDAAGADGLDSIMSAARSANLVLTQDGLDEFNRRSGLVFERAPTPSVVGFAADPIVNNDIDERLRRKKLPTNNDLDQIAAASIDGLGDAFAARYADIANIIEQSTSAEDLEHKIHVHFASHPPARIAQLIEESLNAYAANGCVGRQL
jgi:phage gp29-like protein